VPDRIVQYTPVQAPLSSPCHCAAQLVPTGDMLAAAQEAVEAWSAVAQQPNLIVLRSAFVSSEVEGAAALFLVHDLHPGAVRFLQLFLGFLGRCARYDVAHCGQPQ